ncbi:cupin domain-containing protein [Cladophialophora carrionii]|uniref:Cupin domain-containing protein n=1 Tax=Cladophialophora carrionii TaxID=86049 RepID=A0A1C1CLA5_9EURO|nr:cupin domain-containing protein [Cladophialophora carrionii]
MSGTVESVTTLPAVKRYIATHDAHGKSVYFDSPPQQYYPVPGAGGLARSYSVATVPSKLENDEDLKAYLGKEGPTSWTSPNIVTPGGANLLIVDLSPGGKSFMHQTVSIDFSVCVVGEIDRSHLQFEAMLTLPAHADELDNGEKVRLRPGDHIVRRGTMHRWHNASSTEPARLVVTTLSCLPFDIAGKQLEEIHLPNEQ